MTFNVTTPEQMNAAFADAFNRRNIGDLLQLYQTDASLLTDGDSAPLTGLPAIKAALAQLLQLPGRMHSHNHFCVVHGEFALLRADWELTADTGTLVASGSSVELIRKQTDGRWCYVIDHAVGASLPRMHSAKAA